MVWDKHPAAVKIAKGDLRQSGKYKWYKKIVTRVFKLYCAHKACGGRDPVTAVVKHLIGLRPQIYGREELRGITQYIISKIPGALFVVAEKSQETYFIISPP